MAGFRLGFGSASAGFRLDFGFGLIRLDFWFDLLWIWVDSGLDFALSLAFTRLFVHSSLS